MTVLAHLLTTYRRVYLWFWGVMALFVTGIAASFEIFGPYVKATMEMTIWQGGAQQAPRWFLFVIGIMLATVNLPVIIASGLTRRAYFAQALAFAATSAVLFAVGVMAGFAAEQAAYSRHGLVAFLPASYPLDTWSAAAAYAGQAALTLFGYAVSGWAIGLLFYRLPVWYAIVLIPVALTPVAVASLPQTFTEARFAVLLAALAVTVAGVFLLTRAVPLRPKKA